LVRRTARPLALLTALACGCGPVAATTVIDDADAALARAHAAEGEKYALYETTLADLYLVKAREEQGHARYTEAAQLGSDALKYAETATRKAAERRTSANAPPTPTATVQHPETVTPGTPPPPTPKVTPVPPVPPEKPADKPAEKPRDKKPIDPGEQH
jgi:outer membrane biosynthesis protein TonB